MLLYRTFIVSLIFTSFALAAEEKSVQFAGDHVQLFGTLALPTTRPTKVPALLLIQGSGPTDRDGNQGAAHHSDLLKQIAASLADAGIASLRVDKRGLSPGDTSLPKDPKALEAFCAWDHFVADDLAAERYLAGREEIDSAQVGVLGHSEGGLLALTIADQLKTQGHPAAELILLSTPGRPPQACLREQVGRLITRQNLSAEKAKFFLDAFDHAVTQIQQTGEVPDDVPPGLTALFPKYLGPFFKGQFAIDPAALAKSYVGPVLLVAGAADAQVSPTADAGALDAALASRNGDRHQFVTVPNASHALKVVTPGQPAFAGPLASKAQSAIVSFAKQMIQH